MPVPLAPHVTLGGDEQSHLASLMRAHSTPQALVFRCQLILRTAAPDHPSNLQVAQDLHCNRHTVGRWRSRYLAQGLSGLQDAPRPGVKPKFSSEQRCQMAALACEAPAQSGRPISQWTGREIADELKARGIVEQISPRHAVRLLKKGAYNRTASATG